MENGSKKLEIGSIVKTKNHGLDGLTGIVSNIVEGDSPENHGLIEIKVTHIEFSENWSWVSIGDYEHFCYYQYQDNLEIL